MRSVFALAILSIHTIQHMAEPPLAPPVAVRFPASFESTAAAPPARPLGASQLTADTLYVIDSDIDVLVFASPASRVKVAKKPGPLSIMAKFVDGGDKYEFRDFKGKQIFAITAAETGPVELIVVPVGSKSETEAIRRLIDVNLGPRPPPGPDVDPQPRPTPDGKSPWSETGFRVLITYESSDLKSNYANVIKSQTIAEYLDAKCPKGSDGRTPEYRIYDKDVVYPASARFWKEQLDKRRSLPVPRIAIGDGVSGFEGPLPATVSETLALLKKYGGS